MSRKSLPAPMGASMRVSILASALVLALAGADAHALGLGGIRVQSALNQPFVGEIDLLDVKPDELDTVRVGIAAPEEFSKAGAERFHYLTKLRFSPQISPRGNTVIRVSSREPVREPYMDFLLEVQWPKGRLVKEYTLLLDPPVTSARGAPPIKQPVSRPRRDPTSASSTPPPPSTPKRVPETSADKPRPAPTAVPVSAGGFPIRLGPVRPGTGLWRIALNNSPPGATVAQTAMALYRNNQGDFIEGNINRVIVGRTLTIPSSAELFALSPDAAQSEFEAALRGEKVRRAPIADTKPDGPEGGSGEPRLKIAGAAPEARKPDAQSPTVADEPAAAGDMEKELLLVRESSESTRQETLELRERIRDLEAQLGEIQQLLKLRNAELARIQGGDPAAPAADSPEISGGDQAVNRPEGSEAAELAPKDTSPDRETPVVEGAEPPADTAGVASAGQTTTAGLGPERSGASATESPEGLKPESSVVAAIEEPPASDASWQQLGLPLAGILGVTALGLGALGWARSRRRRTSEDAFLQFDADERPARAGPAAAGPHSERTQGAAAGATTPDLRGSSAFDSTSHDEAETEDADILSEADIYIAYGRYREAEDLLREEIQRMPDRIDLKYKLAEAFFGAKNHQALQGLMEQMKTDGADRANPEHWRRLVDMSAATQSEKQLPSAASPRVPPSGATTADSARPTAGEAFSLDLGEPKQASADLGLVNVPEDSRGFVIGQPSEPRRTPAARSVSASPRLDGHAPAPSAGRGAHSNELGPDTQWNQADEEKFSGGASDLEITIDDLREAADVDLDSFLDSTRTLTTLVDDPPMSRSERRSTGPGPQNLQGSSREASPAPDDLDLSGLLADQEDIATSELLSSQWQMDSGLWDETATKLDLARAYVEMGDPESARGILGEVIAEGNQAQRSEAQELLQGLG